MLLLSSCDVYFPGDDAVGAREFGTVMIEDGIYSLDLDLNGSYSTPRLEDDLFRFDCGKQGQRVLITYYYKDNSVSPGEMIGLYKVLTKDIYAMKPSDADSIGSDRVEVASAWLGGGHLNVQFAFYGSGIVPHFINMVYPEGQGQPDEDGYIHYEFRHNAYGDMWNYWYEDYASFPIEWADDEQVKGCIVSFKDYYGQEMTLKVSRKDDDKPSNERSLPTNGGKIE